MMYGFLFLALIIVFVTAVWAFYVWWKRDHYTRQKFAFFGFSTLTGIALFYLGSLLYNKSFIDILIQTLLKPFGIEVSLAPLTPFEAVLSFMVLLVLAYVYLKIFKHWNGQESIAQHEQKQNNESPFFLKDCLLFVSINHEQRKKLKPYVRNVEKHSSVLPGSRVLAWHQLALRLWRLRNRTYLFEEEDEYDPAHHCWIGAEKNTGALTILACHHDAPSKDEITKLVTYAQDIAKRYQQSNIELIIAVKNAAKTETDKQEHYMIKWICEADLLKDLVDFSDYFADLRYRVERARLTDSKWTLQDTYTPSFYRTEKDGMVQTETLEAFILNWLKDSPYHRQLAMLGEYGQGKSTSALLLSYHLMQQAQTDPTTRIPILIELRGKTLRTMTPDELLSIFASKYHIDAKSLMYLHFAGRLLLIFDGFDEIDLSGDTEARIAHFRTLWEFNHRDAKLLITGRPNFFLDSSELRRALGDADQTITLYLVPFDTKQIADSLRSFEAQIRREIIALAEKDAKFYEVVARPSLLYIVAILWQQEHLSERKNLNSATVIDLFIHHTLRRQQAKHDERKFMVLNSAERLYFMQGIAAYMLAKNLPNQIDKFQLDEAVKTLVDAIPEIVSKSVGAVEDSRPLRSEERLVWGTKRKEILDKITTDVRSCGLLVTDLSKDGAFKFAHKSYMELLQAKVINSLYATEEATRCSGSSIANSWKLNVANLLYSTETIGFLAELLQEQLHAQGITHQLALSKRLWEILVPGKFSAHTLGSLLMMFWINAASFLVNLLINRIGIAHRRKLVLLMLILVLATLAIFLTLINQSKTAITFSFLIVAVFVIVVNTTTLATAVKQTTIVIEAFASTLLFSVIGIALAGILATKLSVPWWLVVPFLIIGALFGSVLGPVVDFLVQNQNNFIVGRLYVWQRVCTSLGFAPDSIEEVVGKGMAELLVVEKERQDAALRH